jgi:divinyl chlorophyllide a 8-vinyl-reductase
MMPRRLTGLPPKYFPVPIALMDGIIGIFDLLAKVFPQLEVRG